MPGRAFWMMGIASVVTAATAAAQMDLRGYSGFVRMETTYSYESHASYPNVYGAIENGGSESEHEVVDFRISDGQASGAYAFDRSSHTYSRTYVAGLCVNRSPGSSDQRQTTSTQTHASASGPASCEVTLDEYGGGIYCSTDVPYERKTETRTTNVLQSTCSELPSSAESSDDLQTQEELGFAISHGFPMDSTLAQPGVVSGSETTDDGTRRRTVSYHLARDSDYELVLVPQEDYPQWRPKGGIHERERGNTLVVRATLRRKDGAPLDQRAKRITVRLSQRSHEPGVMMNDPPLAQVVTPTPPDLQLEQVLNEPLDWVIQGEDGAEAVTLEGSYETVYIHVSSFDWGAYGVLVAEAELHGGTRVAGTVDESAAGPNRHELLIPKRRSVDDPIAESWRQQAAGREGDALSDDEEVPFGDGHGGDGLSLYEEYRGFRVNHQRLEGDTERKELFIRNLMGSHAADGIALFAAQTELLVRPELRAYEIGPGRAVNFNSSGRFQRTRQHALQIVEAPPQQTYAAARGGPGTPASIRAVEIPGDLIVASPSSYLAATIAHELGHSVNIYHHGEGDLGDRAFRVVSGQVYERRADAAPGSGAEVAVSLFYEDGGIFPLELIDPGRTTKVGNRQGQHSGNTTCMMRYDTARFHIRDNPAQRFLNFTDEVVGTSFCSSPTGTGVNAPLHSPAARYGAAASGRGACRQQLCVNDGMHHPVR